MESEGLSLANRFLKLYNTCGITTQMDFYNKVFKMKMEVNKDQSYVKRYVENYDPTHKYVIIEMSSVFVSFFAIHDLTEGVMRFIDIVGVSIDEIKIPSPVPLYAMEHFRVAEKAKEYLDKFYDEVDALFRMYFQSNEYKIEIPSKHTLQKGLRANAFKRLKKFIDLPLNTFLNNSFVVDHLRFNQHYFSAFYVAFDDEYQELIKKSFEKSVARHVDHFKKMSKSSVVTSGNTTLEREEDKKQKTE